MEAYHRFKTERLILLFAALIYLVAGTLSAAMAADSYCAEVKIEIRQELTLERQAFDAHMKINNGLSHIALTDVSVEVTFADEEGNPIEASASPDSTTAIFFIRKDSEGFSSPAENSDGSWNIHDVDPSSSADLHWLIIPTTGASGGQPRGKIYYVGARLAYTLGGEEHITEVTPDYIFVKPLPELALDYFLPRHVYGDDAFTPEIEPPVPFTLGVRVKNFGNNTAYNLKIDSAQPKIIENELGLLIGFSITGCLVNDVLAPETLLADFGNIAPGTAGVARWIMECTLSGEFTSFEATVAHADELGGDLTALIRQENVNSHRLVKDVRVDLAGRDGIRDFLAADGDVYRVYESEGVDTLTTDQSSQSAIQYVGQAGSKRSYHLTTAPSSDFIYVKLTDPENGNKVLSEVVRSDGKRIKPDNAWLSKERKENPAHGWDYYVNLFDTGTTGSYAVHFDEAPFIAQAPVLQFIPDRTCGETGQVSFLVEASNPDGTIPALSVSSLPAGAVFTDQGTGTGIFDWTPAIGQAGTYLLVFKASSGTLESRQMMTIRVCPVNDSDCDGLDDAWEIEHFGDLSRDGSGDFDGDGISDLDEFLLGTDPTEINLGGPTAPEIISPADMADVPLLSPELVIANSFDPDGARLSYEFEVFADRHFRNRVVAAQDVPEAENTTAWTVTASLNDNTRYYWRVRAFDGAAYSLWSYGTFFVNTANDAPGAFYISYPADGSDTDTVRPYLEVTNSLDIDGDVLTYNFTVYADSGLITEITSASGIAQGENGTTGWTIDVDLDDESQYFWKAVVVDPHGAQAETAPAAFTVRLSNRAPTAPQIDAPGDGATVTAYNLDLVVVNATDADNDPLVYDFQLDASHTFDSPARLTAEGIVEGPEKTAWHVVDLNENTTWFWRARACDGQACSPWVTGSFFVNAVNEAPLAPTPANPGHNAWVNTLSPELSVNPALDPDKDELLYYFEIYADSGLTDLLEACPPSLLPSVTPAAALADNTRYYWRAMAEDPYGEVSQWTTGKRFFVKEYQLPDTTWITLLEPSTDLLTNSTVLIQWEGAAANSDATIALYYDDNDSGQNGILIADNISLDPDGVNNTFEWDIAGAGLDGLWYIYAVITDGDAFLAAYAPGAVTIDTTPPAIVVSPDGGTYSENQVITLSADEAVDFFYTLDGTTPDTDAILYLSPFIIFESLTLKCLAIDAAGNKSDIVSVDYLIAPPELTVKVTTSAGSPVAGVNVYAFTESGGYTGRHSSTDENGMARFAPDEFDPNNYRFRIDYLGGRFWTEDITMPGTTEVDAVIDVQTVEVRVSTAAGAAAGVPVYLFTASGNYLGLNVETDAAGLAVFSLPVGENYLFRADILSTQYWSDAVPISAGETNLVPVNAGGGELTVYVKKDALWPMEGIRVYLFKDTGAYLNQNSTTDITGAVSFDVPAGTYKVRADYLGYRFWTADTAVSDDIELDLTIDHQDVMIDVDCIYQDTIVPLAGSHVYLFTETGAYMNRSLTTGSDGCVLFNLPGRPYKARADYLNRQYWSGVFNWEDRTIEIPMAEVEITVVNGVPLADVPVHVFSEAGAYLGLNGATDTSGRIIFRLPAAPYKFRADYQNNQFWSEIVGLTADQVNPVQITVGGGEFTLTVMKSPTAPLAGVNCHVFNGNGAYLGMSEVTSSSGRTGFDLADGDYKFRVDYLGYQFWTQVLTVPETFSEILTIDHQQSVTTVETVYQGTAESLAGINTYLFSGAGTYMNQSKTTEADGRVSFHLPERAYKVRADYLNRQYWSDVFIHQDTIIEIPMAEAEISVTGGGLPREGLPVYVFSDSGVYLNVNGTTGVDGRVTFRMPAGDYNFRADYQGSRYWSGTTTLTADQVHAIDLSVGGGVFTLTVLKNSTEALAGVNCYLFSNTGTYLGLSEVTSSEGQAAFDLADGDYKIRVDYLGHNFWTEVFTVPNTFSEVLTILHQNVTVMVMEDYQDQVPLAGLPVYLFTAGGSYLGRNETTGADGMVEFLLPEGSYKFRADHGDVQVYSVVVDVQAGQGQHVDIYLQDSSGAQQQERRQQRYQNQKGW